MKKTFWLLAFSIWSGVAFAQPWVNLMDDQNTNFYDVQNAFNEHWGDAIYERGKGYKQYKRWEYFMEPRVYPTGERPSGKTLMQALKDKEKMPAKSNSAWQPVGPTYWLSQAWNPGLGRVNVIAVDPQIGTRIYVGTPGGGLWRSNNNGNTWTPLTDYFMSIGVSGIAINPSNSNEIYISTGDGNATDTYSIGVLKTTDGGATWQPTGLLHDVSENIRCSKIVMHPNNHNILWVGTSNGLYVTTNGGDTWVRPIAEQIRDIELQPGNPEIVYASGRRLFRSENAGTSFSNVSDGVPNQSEVNRLEIAVTPANSQIVYMVAGSEANSGFYGLYRSTDGGVTFELRSNTPNILTWAQNGSGEGGQSWYDLAIAASPVNANAVLVGGINVWASINGGNTWSIRSHWAWPSNIGYTHADIHTLEFFNNVLYCGSDGGVFRANSTVSEWTDRSAGLQISQFYKIAVSATDPSRILTAAQDNGTNIFVWNGDYLHLLGGDGNMAAIDYSNHDVLYSAYPGGSFQKSTNGGDDFESFNDGVDETGAWVTPFEIHPTDPSIVYAAFENVWKRAGNNPWVRISDLPSTATLRTLEVAKADPNYIYTSLSGLLYKTSDGGGNWSTISGGLPNLFITSVKTDPADANRVWVTFSGYTANAKVYFSPDGGTTWENQSFNLPNIPVNCIGYGPESNDGIYIGTDIGVFYKEAGQFNWIAYNNGLPNVNVSDIKFHQSTGTVLLGTFGRGVWSNTTFNTAEVAPTAGFTSGARLLCEGDSANFTNLSVNVTDNLLWTFEGGIPDSSNEINPTITYPVAGSYQVKLVVQNQEMEDILVQENYITVISTPGGAVPFEDNFEASTEPLEIAGWYRSGGNTNWQLNENTGFLSNKSLWVPNHNGIQDVDHIIRSRAFDLSAADTAVITMRVAYAKRENSGLEQLRVFTSTDCGTTWSFKKVLTSSNSLPTAPPQDTPFAPQSESEWQLVTINNIPPSERTLDFSMRIIFRSNGGNNVFVDDINLITDATINTDNSYQLFGNWNIYPNPSTGSTTLSLDLMENQVLQAVLIDQLGRPVKQIWNGQLVQGNHTMEFDTNGMPAGVYSVRISSEKGTSARLLVIQ